MIVFQLLLALVWMILNNAYSPADFLVGLVVGFVVITVAWRALSRKRLTLRRWFHLPTRGSYLRQGWRWMAFLGFALVSVIKANLDVARVVLSPRLNIRPGIVAIPLDVKSDLGITLLANLITLTPGTVTLDVATDRKTLYIHTIHVEDVATLRRVIKNDFERRVMELLP